jgi:hypothetical protein
MNPIAIWCKFKDYEDWCYQYRIPNESEFIKGFEYEYINFTITHNDIHNTIEVFWKKGEVGSAFGLPINQIKSYLEAGHVRVKKVNERSDKLKQEKSMKLYYYELALVNVEFNEKKQIKKIINKEIGKGQFLYAVALANSSGEGYDQVVSQYRIKNDPFGETQEILHGYSKEDGLYQMSTGGYKLTQEIFDTIDCHANRVLSTTQSLTDFINLFPGPGKKLKELDTQTVTNFINLFPEPDIQTKKIVKTKKSFIKLFGKSFKERVKQIMKSVKVTIVKVLPNDRYLGHNKGWKPIVIGAIVQPEKSPERLVCIATKDRLQHKRITWKDANELISTQLADDPKWEYIPKEEYKKLNRPTPGLSFIKAQGDKEFQYRMKTPRKSHSTKKGTKSRNKWDKHNKIINLSTYEINIEKNDPKSVGPEVKGLDYSIIASSETKAKNRAFKMSKLDINLKPYYNVVVKRSIPVDTNTQPKKNIVTKTLFEVKEWVSEFSINKIDKMEGDKVIPSTIKIFKRKYEDLCTPFKKTKKWKCPTKKKKQDVKSKSSNKR